MPSLPGLNIVVAGEDPGRLHAALSVAAAWAALDRPARLFLQAEAVVLLRPSANEIESRRRDAGLPDLADLLEESLALGASVTACQSGLALAGLSAEDLPAGVDTGGLVDFLAKSRPDDQLMMA
jgi:predicted peroxiredoxin